MEKSRQMPNPPWPHYAQQMPLRQQATFAAKSMIPASMGFRSRAFTPSSLEEIMTGTLPAAERNRLRSWKYGSEPHCGAIRLH